MTEEAFQKIVEQVWEAVPEKFKGKIENLALLVEDEPSPEVRERPAIGGYSRGAALRHCRKTVRIAQGQPRTARRSCVCEALRRGASANPKLPSSVRRYPWT